MAVKDFSSLALYIDKESKSFQLKGLRLHNFSLQNKYLNSTSLLDKNWEAKLPTSATHALDIVLSGEYHECEAQDILKDAVFNNQELALRIYLGRKLIAGKFLLTNYEIIARYDQFVEFELNLVSSNQVTYKPI